MAIDNPQEILQIDFKLRYPALEKLIESEEFDELNEIFLGSYEKLEKITKGKGDVARKKAAKKAMRSLELTMNLLRDFMRMKDELFQPENSTDTN